METKNTRRPEYIKVMGGTRIETVAKANGSTFERVHDHEGCVIHKTIAALALDELTEPDGPGYFAKKEILEAVVAKLGSGLGTAVEVMEASGNIYWDYITRHLKEAYGAELMGVTGDFFKSRHYSKQERDAYVKRHGEEPNGRPLRDQIISAQRDYEITGDATQMLKLSGRALAAGYGKKTAGWASVRPDNMALVMVRLSRKVRTAAGIAKAGQALIDAGATRKALPLTEPASFEKRLGEAAGRPQGQKLLG